MTDNCVIEELSPQACLTDVVRYLNESILPHIDNNACVKSTPFSDIGSGKTYTSYYDAYETNGGCMDCAVCKEGYLVLRDSETSQYVVLNCETFTSDADRHDDENWTLLANSYITSLSYNNTTKVLTIHQANGLPSLTVTINPFSAAYVEEANASLTVTPGTTYAIRQVGSNLSLTLTKARRVLVLAIGNTDDADRRRIYARVNGTDYPISGDRITTQTNWAGKSEFMAGRFFWLGIGTHTFRSACASKTLSSEASHTITFDRFMVIGFGD